MDISAKAVRKKFGGDYIADERTFIMGIDRRFTRHFAERFSGRTVLETCTGAGFTTISLAEVARHVYTVEIDAANQEKAVRNIEKAGLSSRVTFLAGSILESEVIGKIPAFDAVFIDPDWAATGPEHEYRFRRSNTEPPADAVLGMMLERTQDVALVLPPFIGVQEFEGLPEHELERLYLGESHELFCLYFGDLAKTTGETGFRVAG